MPSKRRLPDLIEAWCEYMSFSEAPAIYNKWVAISMVAAVLKRKVWIYWHPNDIFPNMYILLVGPAGFARKGTAMGPAKAVLSKLSVEIAASSTTRAALIGYLRKAGKSASSTFKTDSGTYSYAALTVFSPEFTVFVGYNNQQLMADLADWYDCPRMWSYDTISRGEEKLEGIYFNLIGATTPELLQSTLPQDAVGGGLMSRTVVVWADNRSRPFFPFDEAPDEQMLKDIIVDFNNIAFLHGQYTLSEDFKDLWRGWYPEQHNAVQFKEDRLSYYVARRAVHALKLSMIFSASSRGDLVMSRVDLERAIKTLEEVEQDMHKPFTGMGRSDIAEVQGDILKYLWKVRSVKFSKLMAKFYKDIDKDKLLVLLATFEASKFIELQRTVKDSQGNVHQIKGDFIIHYKEETNGSD